MRNDIRRGLCGLVLAAAIAALGSSEASAAGTTGRDGLAGGHQVLPAVTAPITVDGNAITLVGDPDPHSSAPGPVVPGGLPARAAVPTGTAAPAGAPAAAFGAPLLLLAGAAAHHRLVRRRREAAV